MSSVKKFFESLSETHQDVFAAVANDLYASAPQDKIDRLRGFHAKLKTEIDMINKRRNSLGGSLNNVNALLKLLEPIMESGDPNLELVLFRNSLQKVAMDLKAEIAATKPENKLMKKFDVARRAESLEQRRDLAVGIFADILKKQRSAEYSKAPDTDDPLLEEDAQ